MGARIFSPTYQQSCYWKESIQWPPAVGDHSMPRTADSVVIGSGFTGLSAARRLAMEGMGVVVLDSQEIGGGASSRNGGIVHPTLGVGAGSLLERYGRERAKDLYDLVIKGFDFLKELIESEGIDCDFNPAGAFEAAVKARDLAEMGARQSILERVFGHETRVIYPQDRATYIGSEAYLGGWHDPIGATLHPARLTRGLARAAARAGAALSPFNPALAVEARGRGYVVSTTKGEIRAEKVVLATNGYTGDLIPSLRRRVIPVRSTAVATEPISPQLLDALFPGRHCYWDSFRLFHYYQITADRRLVFGGVGSMIDPSVRRDAVSLHGRMSRIFPQLSDVKLDYAWDGMVALSFDRLPHIGESEGIYYSLCYNGDGVLLGCYLGDRLGAMVAGEEIGTALQDIPFPSAFFYRRTTWFAPVARTFYGLLDQLGL